MKLFLLSLLVFSLNAYSQESRLDSIVTTHIKWFKETISKKNKLAIDFTYDVSDKSITTNKNIEILSTGINPKRLKNKGEYYLIRFKILMKDDNVYLSTIHFKVEKVSNKELRLINLMNGTHYLIK
ncbi:MAG: hypothetical protein ACO1N9_13515 [Flavobacterium sp.]